MIIPYLVISSFYDDYYWFLHISISYFKDIHRIIGLVEGLFITSFVLTIVSFAKWICFFYLFILFIRYKIIVLLAKLVFNEISFHFN